jgi:hypothetical protein
MARRRLAPHAERADDIRPYGMAQKKHPYGCVRKTMNPHSLLVEWGLLLAEIVHGTVPRFFDFQSACYDVGIFSSVTANP